MHFGCIQELNVSYNTYIHTFPAVSLSTYFCGACIEGEVCLTMRRHELYKVPYNKNISKTTPNITEHTNSNVYAAYFGQSRVIFELTTVGTISSVKGPNPKSE